MTRLMLTAVIRTDDFSRLRINLQPPDEPPR